MSILHNQSSLSVHRCRTTVPCVPGTVAHKSPLTQCGSFLNGLSKLLGKNQGKVEVKGDERRSTVDRSLIGNDVGRPIFPPYTVISKTSEYSLRLYSVFPVVEMEYARREEGYASLGAYIDGKNSQGVSFAYTQPVVMSYFPDGRKVMQMFVGPPRAASRAPAGDGAAAAGGAAAAAAVTSLPGPLEPGMRVNVSGGELVAVLQFEGYITPASAEAARQRLLACLQRDGIRLSDADAGGRFRCAQYGAVYQLGGRLNEMMLQVNV